MFGVPPQQISQEDKWLPSACYMCYGGACGMLVHRVDGQVVGVEGDPTNPMNRGRLCAKGLASPLGLYNPNRVRKPLLRTNPNKSFGQDPKWEEVSFKDANEIILERLSKVRNSDPRKLTVGTFDTQATWLLRVWTSVFGTPNVWLASAGYYCGNGEHPMMLMSHGTFLSGADLEHCLYFLQIGTGFGHLGQH
ncbi:MAG: molybdopterin-binding protein, partial [Thaumarchaeota archaeon]|nr:molybdopterin-binding protein [Nitrososphaerota archaeon]